MATYAADKVLSGSPHRDVVVVSWPEQAYERDRLDSSATPRLWLVEPGSEPPVCESCLEDWLRLPADDADVRARINSLTHRAGQHPSRPTLDEHGQLSQRGAIVFLSPVEQRLAAPLVTRFDEAVPEADLMKSAWPA